MELIDQETKRIMEDCKIKARNCGLSFDDETLEFIVTNQDMIELSPKNMVPTLYNYWVQDVQVIQDKGKYSIFPHNPYETVINTRPAISFYVTDNPDWLNIMIFYHVLGHIDFFQNNKYFEKTWNDDFKGKALSDKRRINAIREELGEDKRFVDYVIEFARGIDNLVNFYGTLKTEIKDKSEESEINYFFNKFLKDKEEGSNIFTKEMNEYNDYVDKYGIENGESYFISNVKSKYPEFSSWYKKHKEKSKVKNYDLLSFLVNESPVVNKEKNKWMKDILNIVRDTSLYFQPQIRTKICNEGWASLLHDYLFRNDERICSHESDYSLVNSKVVSNPKIGLNPYAIGLKLLEFIYDMAEKGKLNNYRYQSMLNIDARKDFDLETGKGWETLFNIRRNFNDFMLINFLDENDFQEFVTTNKLFVAGKKLNPERRTWEYYIKSRNGEDYRQMLIDQLYHPPNIEFYVLDSGALHLHHEFEGKVLYRDYIENVLVGLEYLWGDKIILETTEFEKEEDEMDYDMFVKMMMGVEDDKTTYKKVKVLYICKNREVTRQVM